MTVDVDPFEILGVDEEADEAAIKAAFRKLAKTCHPDVSSQPDDHARFMALDQAYRTLLNPDLRARALARRRAARPRPIADAFDQVFKDMAAASQRRDHVRRANTPIRAGLTISLEQAFSGGPVAIDEGCAFCSGCNGLGRIDALKGAPCGSCRGAGFYQRSHGLTTARLACVDCSSTGVVDWSMCNACGGYGADGKRLGRINLPVGITSGTTLRDVGRIGGSDLEVEVVVDRHRVFTRRQNDLVALIRLPIWDAALGCKRKLTAIDGTVLEVPFQPGTQPRSTQSFAGMGMADAAGKRGELVVIADVVVPDASSGYAQKAFSEMREAMNQGR